MEYSFPRYLLSKVTVDDRALNQHVYESLTAALPARPIRIVEAGAGIGTMLIRLLQRDLLGQAEYIAVDEMDENIQYVSDWIPHQAETIGLEVDNSVPDQLHLFDGKRDIRLTLQRASIFDWIDSNPQKSDLLIAHALLDLFQMPGALTKLFSLLKPGGLAWLTINFDGVTAFEPTIDPAIDAKIETLYHRTMDTRRTGGDSHTGRHLFSHLRTVGAKILAAGASDWVVHPVEGRYPADEAYFLHFILHFFEGALRGNPDLDPPAFDNWLKERRTQIERGELVYIAHQLDFLARV